MTPQERLALQNCINRLPIAKQEQYLGELIQQTKNRDALSPTQRAAFDEERRELKECYDAIMETMDPLQRGIINQRMMDFLPYE